MAEAVTTKEQQEQLVRNNMGLVYGALNRFRVDINEETIQDFTVYLWMAARAFDTSKGFKFSTFAYQSMWNNWQASKRKDKMFAERNHRQAAENLDREVKAGRRRSVRHDIDLELDMSVLSDRERFVVVARADGKTLEEVGTLLEISKERTRQIGVNAGIKMGLLRG